MMIVTILAKMYELGRFWIWKRVEKASKDPRGTFGTHTLPIDVAFLYFWLYTVIIVEMTISRTATIHGPVKWTFRQVSTLMV